MKLKFFLTSILLLLLKLILACPVCEKQQPKITQGFTHGAGPQSKWDWIIVATVTLITLLTLVFSLKYLIKPGEKNTNHIKQSILSN